MPRVLRWVMRAVIGLVSVVLLLVIVIYAASEVIIRRTHDVPLASIAVPSDSEAVSRGERLARVRGCSGGCHGKRLEGKVFFDEPGVARIVAPDLTGAAARFSDQELARIIRHGVRPDGRGVFGMPATTFSVLSDEDLGAILAYLRKAPAEQGLAPSFQPGPIGRLGLVLGQFRSEAAQIAHDSVHPPTRTPRESPDVHGEYLARSVCSECHGLDLRGDSSSKVPDLRIVAGYSLPAFTTLMQDGLPLDGRELRLMSATARNRFRHLTSEEIAALYAYLHSGTSR